MQMALCFKKIRFENEYREKDKNVNLSLGLAYL